MKKVVSMRNLVAAAMLGIALVGGWWLGNEVLPADAARVPASGDVAKYVPTDPPQAVPVLNFVDGDGARIGLDDFRGKVVLLNLWATWCAPCVKEMPSLDRLQARLGGAEFQVVAVSLDRGGRAVVEPFLTKLGARHLGLYLDPQSTAMTALKPRGLPTSLIIDRDGREVGRLEGGAEWDSEDAVRLLQHYIGDGGVRPPELTRTSGR
jgi:thiol-disulfide isomerase/thioredoxin